MKFQSWLSRSLGVALSMCSVAVKAQAPIPLNVVTVTASRIPQDPALLPQGVVVITSEEIRSSGATTANEAIRWVGGILGRTDTTGGRDQVLDVRGFGETAASNVVFLVDGIRQNEGDSAGVLLSWIPVESIQRIDIVRGSGAVLYGEGATAGTINIITSPGSAEAKKSASLMIGAKGTREARTSLQTVSGPVGLQVYASSYGTDNHRENFVRREGNALARMSWAEGTNRFAVQVGAQSTRGGLPGGVTVIDFETNPKKSYKLQDFGTTEKKTLVVTGESQFRDWNMAVDVSRRVDDAASSYVFDGFATKSETHATRAALRAWKHFGDDRVARTWLMGMDTERWKQVRDDGSIVVNQSSDAIYARHEVHIKSLGMKVYAGGRKTFATRSLRGGATGLLETDNTSWDLGVTLQLSPQGEVFSLLGSSFRFPNADEFACYPYPGGPICPPVTLLKPQTSRDFEIGFRHRTAQGKWSLRYYRNELTNEIGFNPDLGFFGANANLDPTQRDGLEIEGSLRFGERVDAGLQLAHRRALFRAGPNAGRTIPMVPKNALTARLTYRPSDTSTLSWYGQLVSIQRVAGDFSNTCADRIPGYGTVNLRYAQTVGDWTVSAGVTNLTDKRYYNYRTRCDGGAKSIYPEAGRMFSLSAQLRF